MSTNTVSAVIGERFGKLVIIGKTSYGYQCLCDCGQYTLVEKYCWGRTRSCECLRKLPRGEASRNNLLQVYMYGAKSRKLSWNISNTTFNSLLQSNCYYCGVFPSTVSSESTYNGVFIYNGIDRLDNNRGYEEDNVVTCCKVCNWLKGKLSVEEFFLQIKKINDFQESKVCQLN